jgi:NitT/TauT family transport system substrate-binding protein
MQRRYSRRPVAASSSLCAALMAVSLCWLGCDRAKDQSAANPSTQPSGSVASSRLKVRVGYIGLTCEAPLFVAYEKGFFRDEGVDAEMTKSDWDGFKDQLGLGKLDITHTLVMYLLKPMEQGLDVKITGGVHRGCLRIQAGTKTDIKSLADLKGKRIGVPSAIGSPPFIFASRVLGANGFDVSKDVDWRAFPPGALGLALDQGKVDAVATSDPIGTMLLKQGKVRNVVDQAVDAPYKEEYCCVVVCNGKFLQRDPAAAAKATRAILKAAKWVKANPMAAATLSVQKKYLSSDVDLNAAAIAQLDYEPSVSGAQRAIDLAAAEMQKAGMMNPSTDLAALSKRAFAPLENVSDEWLKTVTVEQVADGAAPVLSGDQMAALLATGGGLKSCCINKIVAGK